MRKHLKSTAMLLPLSVNLNLFWCSSRDFFMCTLCVFLCVSRCASMYKMPLTVPLNVCEQLAFCISITQAETYRSCHHTQSNPYHRWPQRTLPLFSSHCSQQSSKAQLMNICTIKNRAFAGVMDNVITNKPAEASLKLVPVWTRTMTSCVHYYLRA